MFRIESKNLPINKKFVCLFSVDWFIWQPSIWPCFQNSELFSRPFRGKHTLNVQFKYKMNNVLDTFLIHPLQTVNLGYIGYMESLPVIFLFRLIVRFSWDFELSV